MTSSDLPPWKLIPERYPPPYGSPEALENVGTSAAPLLAGFAFALIGLLLDKGAVMWKPDLALLLLVISGLLLVYAVQFAFNARRFHVPPGDYLAFLKIAAADDFPELKMREQQACWRDQYAVWAKWAGRAYNAGVVVLLFGVGVVLIPKAGPEHMPPVRAAAVAIALLGAACEAAWSLLWPSLRRYRQLKAIKKAEESGSV